MTLSRMIVVLRQTGFSSVLETTYFFGGFIRSPNGSPGGSGSNASACVTYVRRPSRNASVSFISATKLLPMSSCQYGIVQPPCSNPPSRSSSFPPGACITPSSVTNSETTSFLTGSPFGLCLLLSQDARLSEPAAHLSFGAIPAAPAPAPLRSESATAPQAVLRSSYECRRQCSRAIACRR